MERNVPGSKGVLDHAPSDTDYFVETKVRTGIIKVDAKC